MLIINELILISDDDNDHGCDAQEEVRFKEPNTAENYPALFPNILTALFKKIKSGINLHRTNLQWKVPKDLGGLR